MLSISANCSSREQPEVTSERVRFSLDPETPTTSCKPRGSNLRAHCKNARETVQAIRVCKAEKPPRICRRSLHRSHGCHPVGHIC